MIAMDCTDHSVVMDAITGQRKFDDNIFSSVAVLAERLEKLKSSNSLFAGISFSPAVEELAAIEMTSALC